MTLTFYDWDYVLTGGVVNHKIIMQILCQTRVKENLSLINWNRVEFNYRMLIKGGIDSGVELRFVTLLIVIMIRRSTTRSDVCLTFFFLKWIPFEGNKIL